MKDIAPLVFTVFCALIASRDALSQRILHIHGIEPSYAVTVWAIECVLLGLVFARVSPARAVRSFWTLAAGARRDFLYLGIATFVVYAVTIYCIKSLTAPIFNTIDYGSMPLFTLVSAVMVNRDRVDATRWIGGLLSAAGIVILGIDIAWHDCTQAELHSVRWLWIAVALLSPIFTALCSSYQARQVAGGLSPQTILLYRFPLTAMLSLLLFGLLSTPENVSCLPGKPAVTVDAPLLTLGAYARATPELLIVGAITVFLPLWLLCYGFVRAGVGRFAAYLFLIPVLTFLLTPLADRSYSLRHYFSAYMVAAILLMLAGFLVSEIPPRWRGPRPKGKESQDAARPSPAYKSTT